MSSSFKRGTFVFKSVKGFRLGREGCSQKKQNTLLRLLRIYRYPFDYIIGLTLLPAKTKHTSNAVSRFDWPCCCLIRTKPLSYRGNVYFFQKSILHIVQSIQKNAWGHECPVDSHVRVVWLFYSKICLIWEYFFLPLSDTCNPGQFIC